MMNEIEAREKTKKFHASLFFHFAGKTLLLSCSKLYKSMLKCRPICIKLLLTNPKLSATIHHGEF